MANATARGRVGTTPFGPTVEKIGAISTAQQFYPNSMVGRNSTGYLTKFDDAASLQFEGVFVGSSDAGLIPSGGSDGDILLDVAQERYITLAFSSIAVTDIGKTVYASDDQTGSLTGGTYANVIGTLVRRISATSGVVEVPCHGSARKANKELSATRTLAATGAQSLTKFDLNKTILLPNTAAYTVTLPAVADTQAGDRLHFVKTTSDAAAVTLDGASSETIDGATTLATIDAQFDCATLVSTGSAWVVENRDIA